DLTRRGIRVVFGQCWSDPETLPEQSGSVRVDDQALADVAVRTLLLEGHSEVGAIFTGVETSKSEIVQTFYQTASQAGIRSSGVILTDDYLNALGAIGALCQRSSAIFVTNVGGLYLTVDRCYELE